MMCETMLQFTFVGMIVFLLIGVGLGRLSKRSPKTNNKNQEKPGSSSRDGELGSDDSSIPDKNPLRNPSHCDEVTPTDGGHSHRKKVGTALGKPLETRKKAGEDINKVMPVELDNHDDTLRGSQSAEEKK